MLVNELLVAIAPVALFLHLRGSLGVDSAESRSPNLLLSVCRAPFSLFVCWEGNTGGLAWGRSGHDVTGPKRDGKRIFPSSANKWERGISISAEKRVI